MSARKIFFLILLLGFGAAILIPYMNVFLKDRFNISDSTLGFLFSASELLIAVGSLVAPRLSTRLGGKVRAIVATQSVSLAFLLMAGMTVRRVVYGALRW